LRDTGPPVCKQSGGPTCCLAHDLFGKPVPTFPDHALSATELIAPPDGYPAMKEHRLKRPALAMELLMALAVSLVVGMFAWYAVLIWRFFFD
jgi:hypothetical protein